MIVDGEANGLPTLSDLSVNGMARTVRWETGQRDFMLPGCSRMAAPSAESFSGTTVYRYHPITVDAPLRIDAVLVNVDASVAGGLGVAGIYAADARWQPTRLVANGGQFDASGTGNKTLTFRETLLPPGNYLTAVQCNGNAFNLKHLTANPPIGYQVNRLTPLQYGGFIRFESATVTFGPLLPFGPPIVAATNADSGFRYHVVLRPV